MIIDNQGRIFGWINLIDLTLVVILILAGFIAIKFIFFMPDYIHYRNATINVEFTGVPITDLYQLKVGKNYFHMDNDSYLFIKEEDFARCNNKKNNLSLLYYFNDSYMEFHEKYFFGCDYDKNNIEVIYYFDNPMLPLPEIKKTRCTYESVNNTFIYLKDINLNFDDSICDVGLLFKIKARILDDRPFYNYDYQLFKGGYFGFRTGDTILRRGNIVAVQENP